MAGKAWPSEVFVEIKELKALVDEVSALELERLGLDRRSKALKSAEDDLKARIMQAMNDLDLTAIQGVGGRLATLKTSIEPVVADWHLLHQYIRETGALELLHRRVTVSAVKERWEACKDVPGVDRYEEQKLILG